MIARPIVFFIVRDPLGTLDGLVRISLDMTDNILCYSP